MKMQKKKKKKSNQSQTSKCLRIGKLEHPDEKKLSTYHIVRKFTLDGYIVVVQVRL